MSCIILDVTLAWGASIPWPEASRSIGNNLEKLGKARTGVEA